MLLVKKILYSVYNGVKVESMLFSIKFSTSLTLKACHDYIVNIYDFNLFFKNGVGS